MLSAFALVIALNLLQPAAAPPPRPAPPPVSEATPVAVPPATPAALRYYASGNRLWVVDQVVSIALLTLMLFTGLSGKMRTLARRIGRNWFFTIVVYFVLFTIGISLVTLPLTFYVEFVRQHDYGLSNQTLQKWWTDWLTALAVTCAAGAIFLWVPYLLLRKSPRRWWLYTAAAAIPFIIFANLVAPIWIAPLFNRFESMRDKALEARILAMADRAGIEGSRVFEVNKSVDTKTLNAYVAGIWQTKRIVLWDTIIARLEEPELLFVMGHEMGHYVLGHVWKSILFFSALILATLYAIHRTAGWLIGRYRHRFGFESLADVASLPLILLLFSSYIFLVTPIALAFSRHHEHESDRFGLELTRDNRAAATAFVKLQEENLGNPRPGLLVKLWRASHPPLGERIDFCNTYRPWERNEPLVYGHLVRETKAQAP